MSGGLVQEKYSYHDTLENFGKININRRPVMSMHDRMIEVRALPQITRKGNWCTYDQNKFCQESHCCDCADAQKDQ